MFIDELLEQKYEDTFNKVYNNLKFQKENDKNFTKENLEDLLKNMYIFEGHDVEGRGVLFETHHGASMAAVSRLITEWEEELEALEA